MTDEVKNEAGPRFQAIEMITVPVGSGMPIKHSVVYEFLPGRPPRAIAGAASQGYALDAEVAQSIAKALCESFAARPEVPPAPRRDPNDVTRKRYHVEVDTPGCQTCAHGTMYGVLDVIDDMFVGGTMYEEEAEAERIADLLNDAEAKGYNDGYRHGQVGEDDVPV